MALKIENFAEVEIGSLFDSFAELCRTVGLNPAKGNTRKKYEREIRRFVEWQKAPQVSKNAVVITDKYSRPKPLPFRPNDAYSANILTCLIWGARHDWLDGETVSKRESKWYSSNNLLSICGFVSKNFTTDSRKSGDALAKAGRNGVYTGTGASTFYHYNRVICHVKSFAMGALQRALPRLEDFGYLRKCERVRWVTLSQNESRIATPDENDECNRLWAKAQEELGIKYLSMYNSAKLYGYFNDLVRNELGFVSSFYLWEIEPFSDIEDVTEEQFEKARSMINERCVANLTEWISETPEKKRIEAEKRFHDIDDAELLEIIDLFGTTSADIYHTDDEGLKEGMEAELAIMNWFVRLGGDKPYIQMSRS